MGPGPKSGPVLARERGPGRDLHEGRSPAAAIAPGAATGNTAIEAVNAIVTMRTGTERRIVTMIGIAEAAVIECNSHFFFILLCSH